MENKYKVLLIGSLALLNQSILAADIYCPAYITCGINDNNCVPSSSFPVKLYQHGASSFPGKYNFSAASYQKDKGTTCFYEGSQVELITTTLFIPDTSGVNNWIGALDLLEGCLDAYVTTKCPFKN